MTISIAKLIREFTYNGMKFADPGPAFSPIDVRDLFSAQYPELTTASVDGPEIAGEVASYKFVRAAGAKGTHA
ncbi:MAG: PRTRC system protein C [Paraburkholderia tropica]|uniref:PRTRC genetic system protein C n=1 Tax=Paraburkholderia tropica TaxID=92647 RepID=A0ABX5MCB0_9BURK|nr:PRTRC system protein C [Paraburkholderia tropica]PXX05682.1 PRTRC genetic system protein C [Paraburkholderia tropica]PZW70804.1 PRTRC genetic system protein C [Paraburkholderia tropica]